MDLLKYSEREILYMTPRKFGLMMDTYREFHGIKDNNVGGSIDDLP